MNEGVFPTGQWSHKFVHARFSGVLIAGRKIYPAQLRTALADMLNVRSHADYQINQTGRRAAKFALDTAGNMVAYVRSQIDGGS
jgi:hypothetical protein